MFSPITIGTALILFLGGIVGYILQELSVFEIKAWRKDQRKTQAWYDEVERTVNGIEKAWEHYGRRASDEDYRRTTGAMNNLVDDLKEYRNHQNASDEMEDAMENIISTWTKAQDQTSKFNYDHLETRIEKQNQKLRKALNEARETRRGVIYSTLAYKTKKSLYHLKRISLPYDIYTELNQDLSKEDIKKFARGDAFLHTQGRFTRAIYNDNDADDFKSFRITQTADDDFIFTGIPDKGPLTEDDILEQIEDTETVDTIPYRELVPEEKTLEDIEAENSD